jgi:hypothetical protein
MLTWLDAGDLEGEVGAAYLACMDPTRAAHDVLGGMLQVLAQIGAVPRCAVWDQEGSPGCRRCMPATSTSCAPTASGPAPGAPGPSAARPDRPTCGDGAPMCGGRPSPAGDPAPPTAR